MTVAVREGPRQRAVVQDDVRFRPAHREAGVIDVVGFAAQAAQRAEVEHRAALVEIGVAVRVECAGGKRGRAGHRAGRVDGRGIAPVATERADQVDAPAVDQEAALCLADVGLGIARDHVGVVDASRVRIRVHVGQARGHRHHAAAHVGERAAVVRAILCAGDVAMVIDRETVAVRQHAAQARDGAAGQDGGRTAVRADDLACVVERGRRETGRQEIECIKRIGPRVRAGEERQQQGEQATAYRHGRLRMTFRRANDTARCAARN